MSECFSLEVRPRGRIAQLVEHGPYKAGVGSSSLSAPTPRDSEVAEAPLFKGAAYRRPIGAACAFWSNRVALSQWLSRDSKSTRRNDW